MGTYGDFSNYFNLKLNIRLTNIYGLTKILVRR